MDGSSRSSNDSKAQPEKAELSILEHFERSIVPVRRVHPSKAWAPIVVGAPPSEIVARSEQPEKVLDPKTETEDGSETEVMRVLPLKAPEMAVTV